MISTPAKNKIGTFLFLTNPSPPCAIVCPPQVTGTLRHQDDGTQRILGLWDTGTLGHWDTRLPVHWYTRTMGWVGVPTYCN